MNHQTAVSSESATAAERREENQRFLEALAPHSNGQVCIGQVDAIHKDGQEHTFQATEHELEILAQHWAEEIAYVNSWLEVEEFGVDVSDMKLRAYAWHRLNKISEILGADRTQKLIEAILNPKESETVAPHRASSRFTMAALIAATRGRMARDTRCPPLGFLWWEGGLAIVIRGDSRKLAHGTSRIR